MVQKALRRNGMDASMDVDSLVSIEIDEEKKLYILRDGDKEYRVGTIKELLTVLIE
jgi:hypothetical protein